MENSKSNILANFQKNVLKINANSLKIILYSVLIAVVVILIWGYFYGVTKVPKPEPDIQPFPESMYLNAKEYYKDKTGIMFVGQQTIQQEILKQLIEDIKHDPERVVVENIMRSKRFVVIENINNPVINSEIRNRQDNFKKKWETELRVLERRMEEASFFDRSSYSEQIFKLRRKIESINRLMAFANGLRIKPDINLPYKDEIENFQFIAGWLDRVTFQGNHRYIFDFSDGRPVTTMDFMEKAGVKESDTINSRLDKDRALLKKIKKEDYKEFIENLKRINERINSRIDPEREFYRNSFYKKWFMILVLALISYFMIRILLWYYTLIRRKGLPKKTTHEVYFATNTSSLIFRMIALLIVILGIIGLMANLVVAMVAESSQYEMIANLGFWYGIIAPIMITICTIVMSWSFVLWSEFICFLSNCYHVMFVKSHEDITEK